MGFNTNLMIATVVLTMMFLGIGGVWFGVADYYDSDVPPEYQELFDNTDASYEVYQSQQNIMDGGDVNTEGQDQAVYSNVVVAAKQSQTAFRLGNAVLTSISKTLGIPEPIIIGFVTIMGLLSAAAFISAITGNKNN